jgi:hypothetical protein
MFIRIRNLAARRALPIALLLEASGVAKALSFIGNIRLKL